MYGTGTEYDTDTNILMFCITSTFMFCQYSSTKPLWTTISDWNYRTSLLGTEMKLKEKINRKT